MFSLLAVGIQNALFWYLIPLIVAISLVHGATRHEEFPEIMRQSIKSSIWVVTFLGIIYIIATFATWFT